jgi:class 3 adenylate cyclase
MRDVPRSSEPEAEPVAESVRPLGPTRTRGHTLRRLVLSVAYLAPTIAVLAAGGVLGRTRGLVVAGVLIVVATPVVGFTFSQIALSKRGRALATTVADVRSLMEASAAAFTLPFAVLHGLLTGRMNFAHTILVLPELGKELEANPSPIEVWSDNMAAAIISGQSLPSESAEPTFWQCLTTSKQEALVAHAQRKTYPRGTVLCCQAESATVIAIEEVQALVIPTAVFGISITEDRRSPFGEELAKPGRWNGHNCTIFLVDIAAFGRCDRNDDDRRTIRNAMYAILKAACKNSNVTWLDCHREDRGDGALIIVPPEIPTESVVDPLLARLAAELKHYNRQAAPETRIQLRVALHVGPVVSEPEGVSGEAIILASRIIEAPELKKELARTGAHLGVIVSAFVYDSVIKHAPGYVEPGQYSQLRFRVKGSNLAAWMYLVS